MNEIARYLNNTVNDVARERILHDRHHTYIPKYHVSEKESSILWDTGDSFPLKMSNNQIHQEKLPKIASIFLVGGIDSDDNFFLLSLLVPADIDPWWIHIGNNQSP